MKVNLVEIYPVTIPYRQPNMNREGRITEAGHHVVLKVLTDDGIVGLGESDAVECSPIFPQGYRGKLIPGIG